MHAFLQYPCDRDGSKYSMFYPIFLTYDTSYFYANLNSHMGSKAISYIFERFNQRFSRGF